RRAAPLSRGPPGRRWRPAGLPEGRLANGIEGRGPRVTGKGRITLVLGRARLRRRSWRDVRGERVRGRASGPLRFFGGGRGTRRPAQPSFRVPDARPTRLPRKMAAAQAAASRARVKVRRYEDSRSTGEGVLPIRPNVPDDRGCRFAAPVATPGRSAADVRAGG